MSITICMYCRKRVFQARNGEWYHYRGSSVKCRPGEGSDRRAVPMTIARRDDTQPGTWVSAANRTRPGNRETEARTDPPGLPGLASRRGAQPPAWQSPA
jgi:hypothetical protein